MRADGVCSKLYIDLSWISKYRLVLMGIATIGVIMCHAVGRGVVMPKMFAYALNLGNYGVDIFLLLSGMSMYFSLKNRKGTLLEWYKKRYIKILIPFLIIAIPVYAIKCIETHQSIITYIMDITTLSYWTEHGSAWYVAMLLPLYLMTPLLSKIVDRTKHPLIVSVIGGGVTPFNK